MPFWGWILIFFAGVILIGAISDWRTKRKRKSILSEEELRQQNAENKIENAKKEHAKHNHFHGV
ncbi:hypothetical protein IMZ08_15630 [Bacillus luteolus]|uniref:ATP synthase F0 subunit 8 n=1 Tax=Litchfieldia luteola TaxID=682179 RepID=A0ABR9QM49_9BACI|nr:hypothetical protein [Cytobacillus luteolus]MBE4909481.1 hypothetical protein [Cytobacillus luteolus]MBP1940882.1 hypothetical protein [Cytobacillus luteolus]